jgi:hypothetical protein
MHNYRLILFLALVIALVSCQEQEKAPAAEQQNSDTSEIRTEVSKEFKEFYNRYHTDSMFQIKSTHFPLEGVPEDRSKTSADFKWERSDWTMHKPFDDIGGKFHRTFRPIGDNVVIEYIYSPKLNLIMERRFKKRQDGWYLIYYKALGERHPKRPEE